MEKDWTTLKKVEGMVFGGVYANRLDFAQWNQKVQLYSAEPLIQFRKPKSIETFYWKLDWKEDSEGSDILLVLEQEIPTPLHFDSINAPYQKHVIMASSYFYSSNLIEKVSGYGFRNNDSEFLSTIVLKLEKKYITINPSPVIDMIVTDSPPEINELLIQLI